MKIHVLQNLLRNKFLCISYSALPSHDPDEINKDIKSVDDWIKKSKDEL